MTRLAKGQLRLRLWLSVPGNKRKNKVVATKMTVAVSIYCSKEMGLKNKNKRHGPGSLPGQTGHPENIWQYLDGPGSLPGRTGHPETSDRIYRCFQLVQQGGWGEQCWYPMDKIGGCSKPSSGVPTAPTTENSWTPVSVRLGYRKPDAG